MQLSRMQIDPGHPSTWLSAEVASSSFWAAAAVW
jgi:hypothetical protein